MLRYLIASLALWFLAISSAVAIQGTTVGPPPGGGGGG